MPEPMRKLNHYAIEGKIIARSGIRIGGSDDVLQIGGTDLTCIKDPATGRPYLPGSSIKGKMRSALERRLGRFGRDKRGNLQPCGCAREDCPVCRLFGPHMQPTHQLGPTRIKVLDAPLLGDDFKIELKTESLNRRDTGAAEHPRTLERVAAGARFRFRVEVAEFDMDRDFSYENAEGRKVNGRDALIAVVDHGIDLLVTCGLGAGTGKGYGEIDVEVDETKLVKRQRRVPPMNGGAAGGPDAGGATPGGDS